MFQVSLKLKNFFNHSDSGVPIFMSSQSLNTKKRKVMIPYLAEAATTTTFSTVTAVTTVATLSSAATTSTVTSTTSATTTTASTVRCSGASSGFVEAEFNVQDFLLTIGSLKINFMFLKQNSVRIGKAVVSKQELWIATSDVSSLLETKEFL